jgi:DNA polymerase-3 subunit chi
MTRISFYLLQDAQPQARLLTACRLAEKVYQSGSQLYVHAVDETQTQQLDQLLWTFRQGSFIPHERAEQDDEVSPILIGHAAQPPRRINDVLLNLAAEVPVFFSRFARVLEVVDA